MKSLMIAALLACLNTVFCSSANALLINLDISDSDVRVGETFTVNVGISDVFGGLAPLEEVIFFGFDVVNNDPVVLQYLGATVQSPFLDDSAFFIDTDVAGSAFAGIPNTPANSSLVLASLDFLALTVGNPSLGIASDLTDPNEGLGYFLRGNLDISKQIQLDIRAAASGVPAPGTLPILGLGLVLLVVGYRKRSAVKGGGLKMDR
ncbi:hypothetical protein G8764_02550 [Pseudomaricurvus alcaniphilus]|uniref:cohesin domain-containing protein n=1 Tax=Pseudomaricurvus alcaniphilus TaxID=1166482 RepID=UPI00140D1113|nr:cohesin domain-containing protein [Pseudomaricurvus alcaniphilus]NHN36169.1 hypothetical protein [Pseudomaricurvus alcaniphilus]